MIYNYTDNSGDFPVVLAEIEADGILEADIIFKEVTGLNVVKCPHIGISLPKNFTFEPFVIHGNGLFL